MTAPGDNERAIIGALICEPSKAFPLADNLTAEHFEDQTERLIFQACRAIGQ